MGNAAKLATIGELGATPGRARRGRPRLERAGEVEERILEAANKVFLERGFDGASIDLIAETARSGKPTIYSRFPNKEALFAAAVAQRITLKHARVQSHKPAGATIEQRLESIAVTLLNETLTVEFVGLLRLTMAEARRFPDLVRGLIGMARRRGGEIIAQLLAGVAECGELGAPRAGRDERHETAARYFIDLILLPLLMRGLSGEEPETLRAEFDTHVKNRVTFFLAACRHDGIV